MKILVRKHLFDFNMILNSMRYFYSIYMYSNLEFECFISDGSISVPTPFHLSWLAQKELQQDFSDKVIVIWCRE